MSGSKSQHLKHVFHLIAELEAELTALHACEAAPRALAQLDAREAAGEPLTEIEGGSLRTKLMREIEASAARQGIEQLARLKAAVEGKVVPAAKPLPAEAPVAAGNIVVLSDRKAELSEQRRRPATRSLRRLGHAVAVSFALTAVAAGGATWLPGLARLPKVDIAAGIPLPDGLQHRLAAMEGF